MKNDYVEIQRVNLANLEQKLRKNFSDDATSMALIDLTKQLS